MIRYVPIVSLFPILAFANPPEFIQEENGITWAFHDSSDGTSKQFSFKTTLGFGYTIEQSNDLSNWTNFAEFYGVGNTVTWSLFNNPVAQNQNQGVNPVEEDNRPQATIILNLMDTGELVLGWNSLDTQQAVQHTLTGLIFAPEWSDSTVSPIVATSTNAHHFTLLFLGSSNITPPNSPLGALDAAMVADFVANFPAINQSVVDNSASNSLASPPLPPNPYSKKFFRLRLNTALDSDGDGITDFNELGFGNSSPFSSDSDGDGFSDGTEADQGTNPNDSDDAPSVEALIVEGDTDEGVELLRRREITIPAGTGDRIVFVAIHSEEFPNFTSGDACEEGTCPFNDQLRWTITPSNASSRSGQISDINQLHSDFLESQEQGLTFLDFAPIYFTDVHVVEGDPNQPVTITVEAGATNIGDGAFTSTVIVAAIPIDVIAVFGIGPDVPPGATVNSSRKLLENYLDTIDVSRVGNTWLVKGNDDQDEERLYGVHITDNEADLLTALELPEKSVIFDGHSNFGLGPNFTLSTHKTITDFTNLGSRYTDISPSYHGDGTELDVHTLNQDPDQGVPENDADANKAFTRLGIQGFAYIVPQANEIEIAPTNYMPLPINRLRFPNDQGIGNNQAFTIQEQSLNAFHYTTGGLERLMIDAPDTDVPAELNYKRFFYNACNTGVDYIENFQHGEFFSTTDECSVFAGTRVFVQGIVEGKTTQEILATLNEPGVGNNNGGNIYEVNSF